VGQLAGASSLGVSGFVVRHSPDVDTALRNLQRHLALHDHAGVVTVTIQGGAASLLYDLPRSDAPGTTHIMAGAMALGCNLMRALCGDGWAPREVLLAFRKPADVGPYRRFFRAPIRFDADVCALRFPAATLAQPVRNADAALYRILEREVRELSTHSDAPLGDRLAALVRSAISTGELSIERVASLLSMQPRTLNRRLRERGTTFRQVADDARYALSRQLLVRGGLRLADVAVSLGYADASAFARAFRRWSGTSPTEWRRRNAVAAR
jgi:AraC-like DNA-binding protein